MELRHLRYFIAVVEERSFLRAARRLRVAQPAVSKQIRDLEREVGMSLLNRLPRGVQLTRAGAAFLEEARRALESADRAVSSAREAQEQAGLKLRFAHGLLVSVAPLVARLLGEFRETHPECGIDLQQMNESEIRAALREDRLDAGACMVVEWPVVGLASYCLAQCPVTGVLIPASHSLAREEKVRTSDLNGLTFLRGRSDDDPEIYSAVLKTLAGRGLAPTRQIARSPEAWSANMAIAAGDAWAMAGEGWAAHYTATTSSIVYRPFAEGPIPQELTLLWRKDDPSKPVQHLVEIARGGSYPSADTTPVRIA